MKNILLPVFICLLTMSCNKIDNKTPTPIEVPITFNCISGSGAEIFSINEDPYGTTPVGYSKFNGYADPSIRKDPNSNDIWLAYSYPYYKLISGSYVPSVAIHLAKSTDLGNNWAFVKTLFEPTAMNNPANPTQNGYLDHETVNLLPVKNGGTTRWFAARLQYFLPVVGGYASRPNNSFHISITEATSPDNLTNGQVGRIGGNITNNSWNIDQTLVPPDMTTDAFFWNEPALYYDETNGKMYLIMVSFAFNGATPNTAKFNTHVYSTTPTGSPNTWNWKYNGILVNNSIATELGGESVTQTELAKGKDGKLLLFCSPQTWDISKNDFSHKGTKVIEIKSLETPSLERDANGNLKVRATITASDANDLGPASSSYDPNSATGILFTKRIKTDNQLTEDIWKTKVNP